MHLRTGRHSRTSSTPSIACTWLRTTVIRQFHGCRSRTSDSVIPPPPRIVTLPFNRLRPAGLLHSDARAYAPTLRSPATPSVNAISATGSAYTPLPQVHDAVVVEMIDEVLDPGERELHPTDVVGVVERRRQRVDVASVAPHDRLGLVESAPAERRRQ